MSAQTTDVVEDAHATPEQLLARAAADYENGWGAPDVRADDENTDGH